MALPIVPYAEAGPLYGIVLPMRISVAVTPGDSCARTMAGVERVVAVEELHDALAGAEALVLALPLLPSTVGIIGAAELALLAPGAQVVNVARGRHLDTDALVDAIRSGHLGGAGLDVTDPEPLPDGHPLWEMPSVIVTPHTANTLEMSRPLLAARITENVRRYASGKTLDGVVTPTLGY